MPALWTRRLLAALPLLLGLAAVAETPAQHAAPDVATSQAQQQRQAQRERIQTERSAIQAQRSQEEALCYRQFAVEDCLRDARTRARVADNALRRQELQLNDAERREKAAQRLRSIEERRQEQRQKLEAGERPAPMRGELRGGSRGEVRGEVRTPPQAPSRADPQQREQQARRRAEQQQRNAAAHAADVDRRKQAEPLAISQSRARHEARQQQSRERRERLQRRQAEAAASGRKPPAALPAPAGDAEKR